MTHADTTAAREGSELTKSDASQPDGIYIVITIHSVTADIVYIYMLYKYIHVVQVVQVYTCMCTSLLRADVEDLASQLVDRVLAKVMREEKMRAEEKGEGEGEGEEDKVCCCIIVLLNVS